MRDDGEGFELPAPDAESEPGHIGLLSMRERAEAAGGRFALASTPGARHDRRLLDPGAERPA